MPLYTFSCEECGAPREVLCAFEDRERAKFPCGYCDGLSTFSGRPELIQSRDFSKGKYRMEAITTAGKRIPVANRYTDKKRSDT